MENNNPNIPIVDRSRDLPIRPVRVPTLEELAAAQALIDLFLDADDSAEQSDLLEHQTNSTLYTLGNVEPLLDWLCYLLSHLGHLVRRGHS